MPPEEDGRQPSARRSFPTTGQIARAALVVIAMWVFARGVWLARDVLFVVFLAVLLAAFLSIFVDRLQRIKVPRVVGGPLVLLAFVGIIVGLGAAAWPMLRDQLSELGDTLPQALERAGDWIGRHYAELTGRLMDGERSFAIDLREQLSNAATQLVRGVMPVLTSIGGVIISGLVVIFAGLYLTIEQPLFWEGALRLVPAGRHRRTAAHTLERVGKTLRGWMLGTVINMVVVGVVTGLALWALGIPTAFALGLIAGLFEFVPIFGPILAAIPALLIGLTVSPMMGLWVLLLYVGIQQLESNVLQPIVMKGAVKLPPALSLSFQVTMAILFGFIGIVVAVPMLAMLIVFVKSLYIEPMEEHEHDTQEDPPAKSTEHLPEHLARAVTERDRPARERDA
jgi:predicted PurR-regulated permease PerM